MQNQVQQSIFRGTPEQVFTRLIGVFLVALALLYIYAMIGGGHEHTASCYW